MESPPAFLACIETMNLAQGNKVSLVTSTPTRQEVTPVHGESPPFFSLHWELPSCGIVKSWHLLGYLEETTFFRQVPAGLLPFVLRLHAWPIPIAPIKDPQGSGAGPIEFSGRGRGRV